MGNQVVTHLQTARYRWLTNESGARELYFVFEYCRQAKNGIDRIVRVVPHRSELFESAIRSLVAMLAIREDIRVEEFEATPEASILVDAVLILRSLVSSRAADGLFSSREITSTIVTLLNYGDTFYRDERADLVSFLYDEERRPPHYSSVISRCPAYPTRQDLFPDVFRQTDEGNPVEAVMKAGRRLYGRESDLYASDEQAVSPSYGEALDERWPYGRDFSRCSSR